MDHDEESMLDDLLACESGLSGRAIDFLDSLDQDWRDRELSDAQRAWLEDLADKHL